ncbi:MAG TPA: SAM-dependent chlorinase/fluorinase [Solirubrobacteraceae bacterium]|nr:SAM-dependent chlorinase/fluorinase [Solirubrobacteraceae bacterium]
MANGSAIPPVITFLSDYGHDDEFVGVCHGVIVRRCPDARVIDLTHVVPRHDVRSGAILLRAALPYLPPRVHLAVVDPGVSATGPSARRAVALRTVEQDRLLVGPDNGLLMPAAERLGGVAEAVDIGASPECLQPISRTFHGRDIFAPVAAALAAGEPLSSVGEPLPVEELRRMGIPSAELGDKALTAHVLRSDTFGNLILNASNEQLVGLGATLGDTLTVRHEGARHTAVYVATFADVTPGELLIYEDAQRMVSLAVNRGSAAQLLGADQDDELLILPA